MPRYNKSINPSCANNTDGWFTGTRVTGLTVGDTGRTTGLRASYGAATNEFNTASAPALSSTQNAAWSAMGWVFLTTARTVLPYISLWTAADGYVGNAATGGAVSVPANTWTQVRITFTTPASTFGRIRLQVILSGTGSAGTGTFAAVRLEQITDSLLTFADGDTGGQWSWDGTPGSSTSTMTDSVNASPTAVVAAVSATAVTADGVSATSEPTPAVVSATADGPSVATAPGADSALLAAQAAQAVGAPSEANPQAAAAALTLSALDATASALTLTQAFADQAAVDVAAQATSAATTATVDAAAASITAADLGAALSSPVDVATWVVAAQAAGATTLAIGYADPAALATVALDATAATVAIGYADPAALTTVAADPSATGTAEATNAALPVAAPDAAATTAAVAPAGVAAFTVAALTGQPGTAGTAVVAAVLVAAPDGQSQQVAAADAFPGTAGLAVAAHSGESRSGYAFPAAAAQIAVAALGALVQRGNLALYNLDALIGEIREADMAELIVVDLDAALTVLDLDGAVVTDDLLITDPVVATLDADADTRGT